MNPFRRHLRALAFALSLSALGCATTTTESTTWTATSPYPREGRVESVQEVVQRTEGNPAAGAVAGALIGGFLFGGRGPATLFGAGAGAAVGAAASSGSSEQRTYHVLVHFDDGTYGQFIFRGAPPFPPGAAVVLTPQGLFPAGHP